MTAAAPALCLVLGDEELLAARAVAATVASVRDADPDADVREYSAAIVSPGEVAEILSPSLFGGRRAIVINDGQDAKKDLVTTLLRYAAEPDPEVCLIVRHQGGAKGKAFADGLRSAGATVVPAAKLKGDRDRIDFIQGEFRRLGGRCTADAAGALLTSVGNDLRELASACSQLMADTDGRITAETVARYYRGRAEVTGFTVADAVMVGDLPGALEALRWALQVGVEPVLIADALADGVRAVARVAGSRRANPNQLASALGMPWWKVERAQRQAQGWTGPALAGAMLIAAECNAAVKGGAEDRGYALERAVTAMTRARAAGVPEHDHLDSAPGRSRAPGRSGGPVGRSGGPVGRSGGPVGRSGGPVGRSGGPVGRSGGPVDRAAGATGRETGSAGRAGGEPA